MIARFLMAGSLLISICFAAVSHAQEQTPPIATSSPTAPASASAVLSSTVIPTPSATPPQLAEAFFKNLKARSIGPAVMGGRVSDIAIDPRNPFVFYVGLGHGGVFKTNDNGVTFQPIFDKQPMLLIGAVAMAPSDSDVVWVGTGESNDRNSSGWGDGVYRSTDGGDTWQNVGLKESRTIARIVIDPKKPEVAYVAAMGNLWKDGGERGLFKTTDAGKSWKLILHASPPHDAQTGCGDVAMDPANSQNIYAALYARRRTPWSFTSGPSVTGDEDVGGIFKSTDGGGTWKKLSGGLPGQTGRIGWQSAPAIQKSSWQLCRVMKVGLGRSTICAVRAAEFFAQKMAAKHGRA